MKITPNELRELNKWAEFSDLKGINPYSRNEGLIDDEELLDLSLEEAEKLGILK
jgi:hypothetical protein